MKRPVRWYDYLSINIHFLGLTTLAQTNGLVFPLLVQQFVGEGVKGAYLGRLRLWTLMVALLMQAVTGMLSDRSLHPWGRRRPFIFLGTLAGLVFIAAIGFSAGLSGLGGYWFLFAAAVLLSVTSNFAQAAEQGLIPDLVPVHLRGRFSSVKAILELPLPLILVSLTVARFISHAQMWAGILLAMGILTLTMLLSMLAPEERWQKTPPPFNWGPIFRLAVMTGVFTAVILGSGGLVQRFGPLFERIQSQTVFLFLVGASGLAAMLLAVALGVWLSVRISIGKQAMQRHPSFVWWVVNRLAFLVGAFNLSTFAVYFIQARLGLEREKAAVPAANLMMVVGIFILLSALPGGWLADRLGRKLLVSISAGLAALGTALALSLPGLPVIYVGGCLIGIGTGMFYTANWALGTELIPQGEAGRYLGISNLAGAGAGAVGAYIGGPIADFITRQVPQSPGLGYVILFTVYGILFLFSILAVSLVREPGTVVVPPASPEPVTVD